VLYINAIRYFSKRIVLLSSFILIINTISCAQIIIPDPSFEDGDIFTESFYTWKKCQGLTQLFDNNSSYDIQYHPNKVYTRDGDYCIHIVGTQDTTLLPDSINQILGNKISCPLLKGKKHFFC
jgi:hypothetical protein